MHYARPFALRRECIGPPGRKRRGPQDGKTKGHIGIAKYLELQQRRYRRRILHRPQLESHFLENSLGRQIVAQDFA